MMNTSVYGGSLATDRYPATAPTASTTTAKSRSRSAPGARHGVTTHSTVANETPIRAIVSALIMSMSGSASASAGGRSVKPSGRPAIARL